MMKTQNQRKSGIELLRVLAIFLVILSHTEPNYWYACTTKLEGWMDFSQTYKDLQGFLLILIRHFGNIGNVIFLICSAWFLCDSTKLKVKKVLGIEFDVWVISVFLLVFFLLMGTDIPLKYKITPFFPTVFSTCWFATYYLALYCIHPLINNAIRPLSQKTFLCVVVCMSAVFCGIQVIIPRALGYSELVGFVIVYLQTAYVKKYLPQLQQNRRLCLSIAGGCFVGLAALIAVSNVLSVRLGIAGLVLRWNQFANPLIVGLGLSLVPLFASLKFQSKLVNKAASTTLLIYLIHENFFVRHWVRPKLFQWIYQNIGYDYLVFIILGISVLTLVICVLLAWFYQWVIRRPKDKILDCSVRTGRRICSHFLDKCTKET